MNEYRRRVTYQRVAQAFHDSFVQELFENPRLLQVSGLTPNSAIWKRYEFRYIYRKRDQGRVLYERVPGPDLVFFYHYDGKFRFLVAEIKSNPIGQSYARVDAQLEYAGLYFQQFWKAEIVSNIKPSLLKKFKEIPPTDVLLSLVKITKTSGSNYSVTPFKTDIYLGEASVRAGEHFVYFG